jgi:hypothetical protein
MKTYYNFIEDKEPTDHQLEIIMNDATISAIEKARTADLQFTLLKQEYFQELKEKYSKVLSLHGSKA